MGSWRGRLRDKGEGFFPTSANNVQIERAGRGADAKATAAATHCSCE